MTVSDPAFPNTTKLVLLKIESETISLGLAFHFKLSQFESIWTAERDKVHIF